MPENNQRGARRARREKRVVGSAGRPALQVGYRASVFCGSVANSSSCVLRVLRDTQIRQASTGRDPGFTIGNPRAQTGSSIGSISCDWNPHSFTSLTQSDALFFEKPAFPVVGLHHATDRMNT